MRKISKLIATVFFIGYIPFGQGTAASLAALPIYILVRDNLILYFLLVVFSLAVGFWSSSVAEDSFQKKDPPQIVIDEFSSLFLVYLFIPFSLKFLVTGFLLYRVFDIFKIPPIKKIQRLPAGYGIMLDDMASAILTNLILQSFRFLLN